MRSLLVTVWIVVSVTAVFGQTRDTAAIFGAISDSGGQSDTQFRAHFWPLACQLLFVFRGAVAFVFSPRDSHDDGRDSREDRVRLRQEKTVHGEGINVSAGMALAGLWQPMLLHEYPSLIVRSAEF